MSLREETFTELTLVELIRKIPNTFVKTQTFKQKEEKENGSDCELPKYAVEILPKDIKVKLKKGGHNKSRDKNEFQYSTDFVVVTVLSSEFSTEITDKYTSDQVNSLSENIFEAVKTLKNLRSIWEKTLGKRKNLMLIKNKD